MVSASSSEKRPLTSVGVLWAGCVGGVVYKQRHLKNVKLSQRLIHGRLYAQGLVVATLLGVAAVENARNYVRRGQSDEILARA